MYLNKEFYDNFKGYNKEKINKEIENLCEQERNALIKGFSKNAKKKHKVADSVVLHLKKRLSKKSLLQKLKIYDRDIVSSLLNKLTDEEISSLRKEYYLDHISPKVELTNKERKINTRIISNMKKELGTYKIGAGKKEYKPYYEVFSGFTKEEVDHIFLYNTEEEKSLIYKKYGKDFLNTDYREEVTDEENEIINSKILHTMKRRLKSIRNGVSCYIKITDLIDEDLETLVKRSKNITRKHLYNRLVYYFGDNLDKEAYISSRLKDSIINEDMRDTLLGKEEVKTTVKRSNKLSYLLKDARKENETEKEFLKRIRKITKTLTLEGQSLIYKKYGENLNEVHDEKEYTKKERYDLIHMHIPTIKYRLMHEERDTLNIKSFFERFPNDSKESVLEGIEELTDNEKQFLKLVFGERFDKAISLKESNPKINSTINSIVKKVKVNMLEKLKRETGILIMYLKQIQILNKTEIYQEIENEYGSAVSMGIICYLYFKNEINEMKFQKLTGLTYNDIKTLLVSDMNLLRKTTIKK